MDKIKIPEGAKKIIIDYENRVIEFVPEETPLFITEDGIKLFNETDTCWWLRLSDFSYGIQPFISNSMYITGSYKYFSTKKTAQEYVDKNKQWRAELGDTYYSVGCDGIICSYEVGRDVDQQRYNNGLYFRTEKEAEEMFNKIKQYATAKKIR